jgi:hypothetical protein
LTTYFVNESIREVVESVGRRVYREPGWIIEGLGDDVGNILTGWSTKDEAGWAISLAEIQSGQLPDNGKLPARLRRLIS